MLTRKEAIWLTCPEKTCCHAAVVIPTGRDVWRISRTLDAPLASFLMYFPTPHERRDAFLLEPCGPTFRLALGKAPSRRKASPPCIFLLRTRSGQHRCGLGDLRPQVCRALHSDVVDGLLRVSSDGRCACRTWALVDVDIAEETALVQTRQGDAEEYCAVVARWNAHVEVAPAGAVFSFRDYCDYLLDTYDALAALPPAAPPAAIARARAVETTVS